MNKQETINGFKGEFAFLSNFAPTTFVYDNRIWPTAEHLFQAAKATTITEQEQIRLCSTPGQAKRLGLKIDLRSDWMDVRVEVMTEVVKLKFDQNFKLKQKLIETGSMELIEYNTWHDYFWGVCNGRGENQLGKILMKYREDNKP